MPVAHTIPPAAFHAKNCHQCMRLMPASHAGVMRRNATKRPKNTVFPPCRWKKRSAGGSARSA